MSALRALLEDGLPPGVYRWRSAGDIDKVRGDVQESGWSFVLLDTTGVGDKIGFLDACATAFDLPRWFGRNWDALADALGDRSTGEPEIVLWVSWESFAAHDLDAFDVALQVFADDALGSGQLRVLLPEAAGPDLVPPPLADVRVI